MRSAFRGPAHQLAVRMRINNCTHGHNYYYSPSNQPCMHHVPATARAPRVSTLVPFIIVLLTSFLNHTYSMSQKKFPFPFRSVFLPVSTVPVRSVHFCSNSLPRAKCFSAGHELVSKIHCVRRRSIARPFSTTRSRDGVFVP